MLDTISPDMYQLLVLRQGLKACKNGLRLNRAYTPKRLRDLAEQRTGQSFKGYPYDKMIAAVEALINKEKNHGFDSREQQEGVASDLRPVLPTA
jgi:hypothetical protein